MPMTEAEYNVADILLLKMPDHVAFSVVGFMGGNILLGLHDKYSPEMIQEIGAIMQSGNDSVRKFLLREKYLEIIDHKIPHDMLTDKGLKARELGGHKQYQAWEQEEERKRNFENLPKKHWLPYDIVKFSLGLLIGSLIIISSAISLAVFTHR